MGKNKVKNELIAEHFKKRFAQIMEYTMPNSDIMSEEGDDDVVGDMPQDGTDMGNIDGSEPMQQDPNAMADSMGGQEPSNAMGGMPEQDVQMDASASEMNSGMDNSGDIAGSFNPQDNMGMGDDANDVSTMQDGDEVVDITDLTDAQEETQEEIESFDKKFVKAINAIQSLEDLIRSNDSKIEALELELKKRNPTPIEKMNNRAANSYPFNISPNEYWKEKEKNSNYSTEDDNNGKDQEQYTITVGDINNSNDWKTISDTLSDDFIYNQTLDKLIKM